MSGIKRLAYILYVIISLLGVGALLAFYLPINAVADLLAPWAGQAWFPYAVCACVCVCALGWLVILARALFTPRQSRRLSVQTEFGRFQIEKAALVSVVRSTIARHAEVECIKAGVKVRRPRNPKIKVTARLAPHGVARLADLGLQLQEETKVALEGFTGMPVEDIKITFAHRGDDKAEAVETDSCVNPAAPGLGEGEPAPVEARVDPAKTEVVDACEDAVASAEAGGDDAEAAETCDDDGRELADGQDPEPDEEVAPVVQAASELVQAACAADKA